MNEIILLINCIAPILEKKAKTTINNYPSTTINRRKNHNVGTKSME